MLDAALDWYSEGNVILYAPTIKAVEAIAERLGKQGVPIVPYHGKMDTAQRQKNQELWMSGEKRVLVGTLAFGLGINQPDDARGDSSVAAEIDRTVLSGSRPRGPRRLNRPIACCCGRSATSAC